MAIKHERIKKIDSQHHVRRDMVGIWSVEAVQLYVLHKNAMSSLV